MELPQLRLPNLSDSADRSAKAAGEGIESLSETVGGRLDAIGTAIDSLGGRLALAERIDAFRHPRRDEGPNALAGIALLGGLGIGMAVMYFLDPQDGARRRTMLAQRVLRIGRQTGEAAQGTMRDLSNRGRGLMHEGRSTAEDVTSGAAFSGFGGAAGGQPASPADNTLAQETPYAAPALDATDEAAGRTGGPGEQGGGGASGTTAGGFGGGYGSTGGFGGAYGAAGGYGTSGTDYSASGGSLGATGGTADIGGTPDVAGSEGGSDYGGFDATALDQPTTEAGGGTTGGSGASATSGFDATSLDQPSSEAGWTSSRSEWTATPDAPETGDRARSGAATGGGSAGADAMSGAGQEWASSRSEWGTAAGGDTSDWAAGAAAGGGTSDWSSEGTGSTSSTEPTWRPADAGTDWGSSGIQGGGTGEGEESRRNY